MWPIVGELHAGSIRQRFHPSKGTKGEPGYRGAHWGCDVDAPIGTPVRACAAGVVRFTKDTPAGGCMVSIEHVDAAGAKWWSEYLHLSAYNVEAGDTVAEGEVIALSGNSGDATTGPHLHFQIRVSGAWVRARRLKPKTELATITTKKGATLYYIDPTLLVPPPPPLPKGVSGLGALQHYRAQRLGASGAPSPVLHLRKWCQWQGKQAAIGWLIGGGILLYALGAFERN